ncbi:MAG: vitamin K epoxide reductase family protein [Coleofasciculus sp. S288]|nr:vitamin K epoxide reductase family protein [Coleofasciculus sp. S288]
MSRRRSAPWIHRWSRQLIGAIAILGALDTAYLTLVELGVFKEAVCPTTGPINCEAVLASEYAKIFGVPLSLFGFLAYVAIAAFAWAPQLLKSSDNKDLRANVENSTWLLIFAGATAMTIFSGYLVYLMSFKIGAFCIYCLASAFFSLSLLVLTLIGRAWEDMGQLFFTGIVVGMIALIGMMGVYASAQQNAGQVAQQGDTSIILPPTGAPKPGVGWEVTTTSGPAEIALARHLKEAGVKEYVAYWCPHCHEQKSLFGKEAYKELNTIECAADAPTGKPEVCKAAGVKGFPSWEINGQMLSGIRTLDELADLTDYQGPRDFKYSLPQR